jgi:cytochrome c556
MDKVLTTLVTVSILGVSLYGYSQIDRIQDMQIMETAMAKIQKGILYNNKDMVLQGVEKLKNASVDVEITPKNQMDYSSSFAKKQSKNIIKYADKIKENILLGHKHGASKNYTKVLAECITCHNKIRKWN